MNTMLADGRSRLRHVVLLLLALAGQAAWAEPVGRVLFTVGEVRIAGSGLPLAKGAPLEAGQVLETGAGGHVHIRFVDDAFVSIRPGSRLQVDEYVYDPAAPQRNRVKFTLQVGTSRLITGKAGQANKEGFRLNTPMAAIGVRGTDFVVSATADGTRVSVQQGAVVVAPFGQGCSTDGVGPCASPLARQLSGSLSGAYLELNAPDRAPVLVTPADGGKSPNRTAPPRPEEPAASASHLGDAVAASQIGALPATPQVWWGRWGAAGQAELTPGAGREIIARSDLFILMRSTDNLSFPSSGVAKFKLAESEAYTRTASGAYLPASVRDASLTVDFGKQQFSTSLAFVQGGSEQAIQAQGSLTASGRFKADPMRSNALISGALSGNGNDAAYYFQKTLENQAKALGVVRWQR